MGACKCPPPKNGYGCPCENEISLALGAALSISNISSSHEGFENYFENISTSATIKFRAVQNTLAIPGEVFSVYVQLSNGLIYPFNVHVQLDSTVNLVAPSRY